MFSFAPEVACPAGLFEEREVMLIKIIVLLALVVLALLIFLLLRD